jgi:hypothetical protein
VRIWSADNVTDPSVGIGSRRARDSVVVRLFDLPGEVDLRIFRHRRLARAFFEFVLRSRGAWAPGRCVARLVFPWRIDCRHAHDNWLRGGKSRKVIAMMHAPENRSTQYDAYFINGAGYIVGVASIASADRQEALYAARHLVTRPKCLCIELWHQDRCIAVVDPA